MLQVRLVAMTAGKFLLCISIIAKSVGSVGLSYPSELQFLWKKSVIIMLIFSSKIVCEGIRQFSSSLKVWLISSLLLLDT